MVPFESSSKLIILLDLNTLFSEDIFIFTNLLLLFFNKNKPDSQVPTQTLLLLSIKIVGIANRSNPFEIPFF